MIMRWYNGDPRTDILVWASSHTSVGVEGSHIPYSKGADPWPWPKGGTMQEQNYNLIPLKIFGFRLPKWRDRLPRFMYCIILNKFDWCQDNTKANHYKLPVKENVFFSLFSFDNQSNVSKIKTSPTPFKTPIPNPHVYSLQNTLTQIWLSVF